MTEFASLFWALPPSYPFLTPWVFLPRERTSLFLFSKRVGNFFCIDREDLQEDPLPSLASLGDAFFFLSSSFLFFSNFLLKGSFLDLFSIVLFLFEVVSPEDAVFPVNFPCS